jgi:hypothetical protein
VKVTVPVGATLAVTAAVKVIVLLDEYDHTTVFGLAVTVTVAVGTASVSATGDALVSPTATHAVDEVQDTPERDAED